jgi:hypothetical protein
VREQLRLMCATFRAMLDLGGPLGVLIYKRDGSLARRIKERP